MEFAELRMVVWILLCLVFGGNGQSNRHCPERCTCNTNDVVVRCSAGMSGFPAPLTPHTKLLSVSGNYKTHNRISSLRQSDFQSLPALQSLWMSHSEIQTIADDTLSSLIRLQYLDLSYNNIPRITDKTFLGLTNLVSLQISGNSKCDISEKAFDSLVKLQELYIADMDLERIVPGMFANTKDLQLLDIHGNKIWKMDFDFGATFPNLQHLDVSGNLLKGIRVSYNQSFSKLDTVKLSGNPLQCNCALKWLKKLRSVVFEPEYGSDALVCYGPERLKYAPILGVPESEFKCRPPVITNCSTDTYVAMEAAPLRMSCDLDGDPYPDVTWTRPDDHDVVYTFENTSDYHVSRMGSLDIFRVSKVDAGTWTLRVSNIIGIGRNSHQLKVIVTPKTTTTTSTTTPSTTRKLTTSSTTTTTASLKTTSTLSNLIYIDKTNPATVTTQPHQTQTSASHIAHGDDGKDQNEVQNDKEENGNTDKTETKDAGGGMSMVMVAGAGGGGLLVGVLLATAVYCIKRKKDSNRVEDIRIKQEDDFDSVRTPRYRNGRH